MFISYTIMRFFLLKYKLRFNFLVQQGQSKKAELKTKAPYYNQGAKTIEKYKRDFQLIDEKLSG